MAKGGSKLGISALILLISGVVCKALGALFRLPLTNMLGIEGIGVFQLVMSLYSFALVLTCGGVTNALTKLISSARAKKEDAQIGAFLSRAMVIGVAVGLGIGGIFFALSRLIVSFQSISASTSYMLFILLLPLGAVLAALRGFFQGYENMLPTAISQVLEQVTKFALGLGFAYLFGQGGLEQGVFGAFLGIVLGEAVAAFYLFATYFARSVRRQRLLGGVLDGVDGINGRVENNTVSSGGVASSAGVKASGGVLNNALAGANANGGVVDSAVNGSASTVLSAENVEAAEEFAPKLSKPSRRKFFKTSFLPRDELMQAHRAFDRANLPLMLSASILPLVNAFDGLVIISRLSLAGLSSADATQLFGLQSGVVGAILNFPLIISMAVTTTLLPNISFLVSRGAGGKHIVERGLKVLLFLILPTTFGVVAISRPLLSVFYPSISPMLDEAYLLMFYGGFSVVLTALMQYFVMLLQANGQFRFILIITAAGGVVKAVLSFFLASVPSINIFALAIGNIALAGIICTLAIWRLKKNMAFRVGAWDMFLLIFATLIMFVAVTCFLNFNYFHPVLNIFLAVALGVLTYAVPSIPVLIKILPSLKNHVPFRKH